MALRGRRGVRAWLLGAVACNVAVLFVLHVVMLRRTQPSSHLSQPSQPWQPDQRYRYVTSYILPTEDAQMLDMQPGQNGTGPLMDQWAPQLDTDRAVWDKTRVFKIYSFVVDSEKWNSRLWNICLSTQCSVDLLFWVMKQLKNWKGPISVAVFVPDVDYTIAIKMIQYIRMCSRDVRRVSFHMVHPNILPPKLIEINPIEYDCSRPEDFNIKLVNSIRTDQLIKTMYEARYPQNLLRNVARQSCPNQYCFTPDIDMLSIPLFSQKMNKFFTKPEIITCKKCAFVIPTYEISTRAQANPIDKKELKSFLKKKLAQRFHTRVFSANQANSNLPAWEQHLSKSNMSASETHLSVNVAYNITTWKNNWEPIYITEATVPLFDERFIGYGFTRNSQVYEMHLAGYTWHMLDNVFLTHRGFQYRKDHSRSRRLQVAENNRRYNVFVRELGHRYGVKKKG